MINRNELANAITEYSHTLTSKIVAVVGGTSAVSHTTFGEWVTGAFDWLASFGGGLTDAFDWFLSFPWMTTLSYVAIILLIIERGFIVWAWNNRRKRGEL